MQLDPVRGDATLTVDVVKEADPGDPHEWARHAPRRVQVVHQFLAHLRIRSGEPRGTRTRASGVGYFRDHRDGRVAWAREDQVVVAVCFAEE